jgi:hypothetical protein
MTATSNASGEWVEVGGDQHELIYSMLSLEKIELQFGSLADMQNAITDEDGTVRMDKPVVTLLIDIVHAGLLHVYDDSPAARRQIASGIPPAALDTIVDSFTRAFTKSFGDMGKEAMAAVPNRADRRQGSPGTNGTTSPRSSSSAVKKSGKK